MDWNTLADSYELYLLSSNKARSTTRTYMNALRQFIKTEPNDDHLRQSVQRFLAGELAAHKPATVSIWYRSIQQFFKWADREAEIQPNPMSGLTAPIVPLDPPDVIPLDQIRRLLASCEGTDFRNRRDLAIIRLLVDTGMRRNELTMMTTASVDLRAREVIVMGKNRRNRTLSIGVKTTAALDAYLRSRRRHLHHELPDLWISHMGKMTASGIYQVVRDRGETIGIEGLYPHQLRHTFAHEWLVNDGSETNLMSLAGWQSSQMLRRYGASAAQARALEAHKKLALGDRI